jgi:hypothetical protein
MHTYSPTLDSRRQPLPSYDDYMANQSDRTGQTAPAYPQAEQAGEAKKFEVAKDSAFREGEKDSRAASLTNNGGPLHRGGPIGGAAQGAIPEPRPDKATGAVGVTGFCGGSIDIGPKGLPRVTDFGCGVTPQTDWNPDKKNGYGPGFKNREPGVATGPVGTDEGSSGKGGSVYTLGDAKKAGSTSTSNSSSTANDGTSGAAYRPPAPKDPVPDSLRFDKLTTPPQREINDLGPPTNELKQRAEDAAVARNDQARFGDDIAQRV